MGFFANLMKFFVFFIDNIIERCNWEGKSYQEIDMLNNGLSYRQKYPTKSNVDNTLLGQGGGGGNFYQGSGDGGAHDDESPEDETERE